MRSGTEGATKGHERKDLMSGGGVSVSEHLDIVAVYQFICGLCS